MAWPLIYLPSKDILSIAGTTFKASARIYPFAIVLILMFL
jgi:hypothetical protein